MPREHAARQGASPCTMRHLVGWRRGLGGARTMRSEGGLRHGGQVSSSHQLLFSRCGGIPTTNDDGFAASRPRWFHRHNCKAASSSTNLAAMVTGNRCFVAFLIRRQAAGQPPCAPAACAARPWQQTPNWQPSRAPTARAAAFQHWGHYAACTSANERFERLQMRRDACTAAPP